MSTSRKHTHTGHCQACARVHAVDVKRGDIAKHGYNVRFGYFAGVCSGSDHAPLEVERTFADETIVALEAFAKRQVKRARDLLAGTEVLTEVKSGKTKLDAQGKKMRDRDYKYIPEMIAWADATAEQRARAVEAAATVCQQNAIGARAHAKSLAAIIPKIHGQPLISVAPVDAVADAPLAVGDVVRVWGKTGFDAECIALRYAVCHGQGPSLNGHSVMHAVFRRPTGGEVAIPLRKIRRASIVKRAAITA